ncbi:hypothetical protein CLV37_11080 [Kineococcus rhizosphaerae]|uniref:Uncharacterized protein n=1 Tax=Kineococcus rhizosphaerae TaxID=559628 RepID=A0A2T0R086_9ACTN|nr:hypothetical protein CLV37_11080 [Kineococcus rhizosphaerae]
MTPQTAVVLDSPLPVVTDTDDLRTTLWEQDRWENWTVD